MNFIAGLFHSSNVQSQDRWTQIVQAEGLPSLRTESRDGSARFEVIIKEHAGPQTPDKLALAKASVLRGICFSSGSDLQIDPNEILNDNFLAAVRQSRGAHFSNEYWGHYVGLFFNSETGSLTAVRDPSGGRSLYFAHFSQTKLFLFSDSLQLLCRTIDGKLAVDRKMIVMGLAYLNGLPTRRTAFEAITSLLPGECMEVDVKSGQTASDLPWWRKITSRPASTLSIAEAVERSAKAWSSVHRKIALQLSGGLDSSGLLGMLAKLGRADQVHCLTCYRSSGVTDERHYARVAANHAGTPLTEFDIEDLRYPLSLSAPYKFSARPHAKVLFTQLDESFDAHARAAACGTYWMGFGGDTLFMNGPKSAVVIDALRQGGLRTAFGRAVEIALYEEKPLWRVLWDAGTKSWNRRYVEWAKCMRSPWAEGDESLEELDQVGFQLIEDCFSQMPLPGQRNRFYDVYYDLWATAEQRYFFVAGGVNYASPYYSEPVIEAAASSRSYEMVNYGLNRFAQREFVADVMPQEIAGRIVKGGADDQVIRALLADADRIEALLANGHLASLGLVDADSVKIERGNIAAEAFKNFNIVNMLASEVWLSGHRDILEI